MIKRFSFEDIHWPMPDAELPPLDRAEPPEAMTQDQLLWRRDGVLKLSRFIPDTLIDAYKQRWLSENVLRPGGWPHCTPYMSRPEIRNLALYPPLVAKMRELIGDDMGLHLNLTGWVSTQRDWHSDIYLNPDPVLTWYIAAWVALEDIHPDSGPFQFVRGSHRWGATNRDKLFQFLPDDMKKRPSWPAESQDAVSECFRAEIVRRDAVQTNFLGKRGDVLLWHGALVHRGTKPTNPKLLRHAFIAHYSGLSRRHDMPKREQHDGGGWYFSLGEDTPV